MLSLKQIKNLENESFFKEAIDIHSSIDKIIPKKKKTYLIGAFISLSVFSFLFYSIYMYNLGLPKDVDEFKLMLGILPIATGGAGFSFTLYDSIVSTISKRNKLQTISNICHQQLNYFYDYKKIKKVAKKIEAVNKEVSYMLKTPSYMYTNVNDLKRYVLLDKINEINNKKELPKYKAEILSIAETLDEQNKFVVYKKIEQIIIDSQDNSSENVLKNIQNLEKKDNLFINKKNKGILIKNI